MKLKKTNFAFTLAEILIVLTIIGVMAVMTIPSLIQNSNSQQKIAQFKKGYSALSNAYATEFALKQKPTSNDDTKGLNLMFNALVNQLNIKYFWNYQNSEKVYTKPTIYFWKYRIITEDGITYYLHRGDSATCPKKLELNKLKTSLKSKENSCLGIWVLLGKPDKENPKLCSDNENLTSLNCDYIRLFVASDGITAGNPDCTIAGRIMGDNIEYDENKCKEEE